MRILLLSLGLASPAAAQLGTNYCSAVPNSTGVPSVMGASGSANVLLNDVTLECGQLPVGSAGYFLTSFAQGFVANPAGAVGNLCLGQPIGRYINAVLTPDAQGGVELPIDLGEVPMSLGAVAVQPGESLAFQYWHRDQSPLGAVSNFSDGLEIAFEAGCEIGAGIFPTARFEAGEAPFLLVDGDLNGDGLLDLVATNPETAELRILYGTGDARFSSSVAIGVGMRPTGLELGDMDGDGDLDLVCSNQDFNTVSVVMNLGGGTFAAHVETDAGAGPAGVDLGDVDGDGDLDVVVANSTWTVNTVSILRNDGTGSLMPRTTLASERTPRAVKLVDLDADGDEDLLVANGDSSTLATFLNDGTGSYGTARYDTATFEPRQMVTADFDGDGHVDVAIANSGGAECALQLGAGDGTFRSRVSIDAGAFLGHLAVADLNDDGILDLVGALSFDIVQLLGVGDGTFSAPSLISTGRWSRTIVAADFDGEPGVELAVTLALADDIAVVTRDGSGGYQTNDSYDVGTSPNALVLEDVTGDGVTDFLVTNQSSNTVSLGIGLPDGTFGLSENLPVGDQPVGLVAVDLDGDGDLDVAVANNRDESVSVLFNLGGGVFAPHQELPVERFPRQVAGGDIDGDGDIDLLTAHGGFGPVNGINVLLNDGTGSFSSGSGFLEPTQSYALELVDLDLDGDLDVVIAFIDSPLRGFRVLPNDGFGGFGTPILFQSTSGGFDFVCTDLDSDGDSDIALIGGSGLEIFENLSALSFGQPLAVSVDGEAPNDIAAGDVNLDGKIDLVMGDQVNGAASVLLGRGDLTWEPSTRYAIGVSPRAVGLADLDGDGLLDMVSCALGIRMVTVHKNLCR